MDSNSPCKDLIFPRGPNLELKPLYLVGTVLKSIFSLRCRCKRERTKVPQNAKKKPRRLSSRSFSLLSYCLPVFSALRLLRKLQFGITRCKYSHDDMTHDRGFEHGVQFMRNALHGCLLRSHGHIGDYSRTTLYGDLS